MSIVSTLQEELDRCTSSRRTDGSILISVITVLSIIHKTVSFSQISEENCVAMANLLRESYKPEHKTYPAYAALDKHLTTDIRYNYSLGAK